MGNQSIYRAALVLSGGGARAIAHLGVLQALEEMGVQVSAVSGTSAGALAGALYAYGHSPSEIREMLKEYAFVGASKLVLYKQGMFSMEGVRQLLANHIPARFEDLRVPLYVAATDLAANKSVIFSKGPLLEPLLASCCVPFVFEPVVFEGTEWVDGGILNNFPVEPLRMRYSMVIGSHVNKLKEEADGARSLRKMHILEKCFHLAVSSSVYGKASACSVFLDPPGLDRFRMFDFGKADEIYAEGYRYCMEARSRIMDVFAMVACQYA